MKRLAIITMAAMAVAITTWVATAPNARADFATNPVEMNRALFEVAEHVPHDSEPALRVALARTYVVATTAQCQITADQPVQGYAYYDYHAKRPVICVSGWDHEDAQLLIVWAHEMAHVVELMRDHDHLHDPHDMGHYQGTYDILSEVLELANISEVDKFRLKVYYRAGSVVAPFTDAF